MRRMVIGGLALAMSALAALSGSASADDQDIAPQAITPVVINEVSAIGPNGEHDEAIELVNLSSEVVELENYVLRIYNAGNQVVQEIRLGDITLQPAFNEGDVLVITGVNFSGTVAPGSQVLPVTFAGPLGLPVNGGVALFSSLAPTAQKVDGVAMSMGASIPREGQPAIAESQRTAQLGASNQRNILSTDTNNNRVDFQLHTRTFGSVN